jgi:poly(A) polymerase
MNEKNSSPESLEATAADTQPVATNIIATPRVVDESAYDGGDDDDDEDDDVPNHLGMVVRDDEGPPPPQDQHEHQSQHGHRGHREPEPILLEMAENPEIALDLIDADALWVVKRLRMKGYEAYLTGGCVRDLLLGRKPKDFDVATAAHPNQVRTVFRNCRLIGRRFRLAHVYFANGKVIETATFRANPIEIAAESAESTGNESTDDIQTDDTPQDYLVERDNVFGNVEQDARRRDLTINGLFYDPVAGKVIDYVDGRRDLEQQLIRTIGDPDIRFQEDPVRIMRAIKFATRPCPAALRSCSPPRGADSVADVWLCRRRHDPRRQVWRLASHCA